MKNNAEPTPTAEVVVLDDDESVRQALASLLRSVGYNVTAFAAPHEFLASKQARAANCLILDVRMPMASGFDLQGELAGAGIGVPVIFMTGYGDIPMSVRAMKAGAVDFLPKPFRDQDMLDAVAAAVNSDRTRRESETASAILTARFETLTERERQVMRLATTGMMNKQIAFELGLSEITVKIHRGKVMRKMQTRTFAELVRSADTLGLGKKPE